VDGDAPRAATLTALNEGLRERFGIAHTTLQLESPAYDEPEGPERHR
jgi:hypothetical protein